MWEMALLAGLALVGLAILCFGLCAWLSPRVLDWLAAHADSRAHALRAYRVQRAESLAEQLKLRQRREGALGVALCASLGPVNPSRKAGAGA